jgi:tetratricopeptide (TPR) repeat protein
MQRVVGGSGAIVRAAKLPPAALVAYVGLPEMTLNGFRGHVAVQVWRRDTSARFVAYVGAPEVALDPDLVLSYDTRDGHDPVLALVPEAVLHWSIAEGAGSAGRTNEAREQYLLALAAQKPESPSLSANALQNLALYELEAGHLRQADSLNKAADRIRGLTPNGLALDALISLRRGNLALARTYLANCLRLDPSNAVGRAVLQELQAAEAQGRIPADTSR